MPSEWLFALTLGPCEDAVGVRVALGKRRVCKGTQLLSEVIDELDRDRLHAQVAHVPYVRTLIDGDEGSLANPTHDSHWSPRSPQRDDLAAEGDDSGRFGASTCDSPIERDHTGRCRGR
jgi:hypothetical protein